MFPPIEYLEWIAGRPERAEYDLGTSNLRAARPSGDQQPRKITSQPDRDPVERVAELLAAEYGVERDQVLVTAGATHANFLAVAAALDGSERGRDRPRVLVESPGYEPLVATPKGLGGTVDRFPRSAPDRYRLRPETVADAVEPATDLVVVTNRHNPSGVLADRATVRETAAAAGEMGATLLVDEVYAPFTVDPDPAGAFGGVTAAGLPNTVVTGSLTKFFGLGSLRVGWLVGPREFLDRARSVAWHVPAVAEPSAARAAAALDDAAGLAERSRGTLAENHDLLSGFFAGRDDLDGFVAVGNAFAFLAHDRSDGGAVAEAAWERGVLVVPGRFFGEPDRFRVNLGREPDLGREGLAALGEVLAEL